MRVKSLHEERITDGTPMLVQAKLSVCSITLINQSDAAVLVGINNDRPFTQLAVAQSIIYDAGENSFWGDMYIKVNFDTATVKEVVMIQTHDYGTV